MEQRFWRNNSQIIDNAEEQDRMVLAEARNDREAQRVVDLLNQLNDMH